MGENTHGHLEALNGMLINPPKKKQQTKSQRRCPSLPMSPCAWAAPWDAAHSLEGSSPERQTYQSLHLSRDNDECS